MQHRIWIVRKRHLIAISCGLILIAAAAAAFWGRGGSLPVDAMPAGERVIHMITGEFSTTTAEGQHIESYRWDPGTVFVNKGENVKLKLFGVNGSHHPFIIEGLNIQGVVKKGEETTVSFHAAKEGIYRIICFTHPDSVNNGPMIGYIVID